jgi:hypothetical protein
MVSPTSNAVNAAGWHNNIKELDCGSGRPEATETKPKNFISGKAASTSWRQPAIQGQVAGAAMLLRHLHVSNIGL